MCGGLITVNGFNIIMTKLVIKYLTAPPTSVPSEFLFSVVGDVYYEKTKFASTRESRNATFLPIIHAYVY